MRYLLAALILSLAVPALGQERVPSWQDPQAVPDPIPINICVIVTWTEKSRSWQKGQAFKVFYPPLDAELRADLKQVEAEGLGTLSRCSASNS